MSSYGILVGLLVSGSSGVTTQFCLCLLFSLFLCPLSFSPTSLFSPGLSCSGLVLCPPLVSPFPSGSLTGYGNASLDGRHDGLMRLRAKHGSGIFYTSHFINYVALLCGVEEGTEWRKGCRWWWLERRRWCGSLRTLSCPGASSWLPTTFVCTLMDSFLAYLPFFLSCLFEMLWT